MSGMKHGEVTTRVDGNLNFANTQTFILDATEYKQSLVQSTSGSIVTTTTGGGIASVDRKELSYPFTFLYDQVQNSDGTFTIANQSDQKYLVSSDGVSTFQHWGPFLPWFSQTSNEVVSSNNLYFDASGNYTGNAGSSSQQIHTIDSSGYCYSGSLTSKNLALTSFDFDYGCRNHKDQK